MTNKAEIRVPIHWSFQHQKWFWFSGPDSICCQPKEERNRCTSTLLIRSSFEILFVCCCIFFRPPESHHSSIGKEMITTEAMLNIVGQKRWRILQLWDARFMAWLSMCLFFGGEGFDFDSWWIFSKALRVLVVRWFGCEWSELSLCVWNF